MKLDLIRPQIRGATQPLGVFPAPQGAVLDNPVCALPSGTPAVIGEVAVNASGVTTPGGKVSYAIAMEPPLDVEGGTIYHFCGSFALDADDVAQVHPFLAFVNSGPIDPAGQLGTAQTLLQHQAAQYPGHCSFNVIVEMIPDFSDQAAILFGVDIWTAGAALNVMGHASCRRYSNITSLYDPYQQ